MHLIVTRPQPDAEELQRKLEVKGHQVSVAPLLDIRMGPQRPIAKRPYQAVLVTSANGARAFAEHPGRDRLLNSVAYAVGLQAGGDVNAIIAQVRQDLDPTQGPLLYLSGEETSGDLEALLNKIGFEVDRVVMYAAVPAAHLPAPLIGVIKRRIAEGVLLYSRRTAKVWFKCIVGAGLEPYMDSIAHFCLSPAVASVIPGSWGVRTAPNASEQGMFDLIEAQARVTIEGPGHGR